MFVCGGIPCLQKANPILNWRVYHSHAFLHTHRHKHIHMCVYIYTYIDLYRSCCFPWLKDCVNYFAHHCVCEVHLYDRGSSDQLLTGWFPSAWWLNARRNWGLLWPFARVGVYLTERGVKKLVCRPGNPDGGGSDLRLGQVSRYRWWAAGKSLWGPGGRQRLETRCRTRTRGKALREHERSAQVWWRTGSPWAEEKEQPADERQDPTQINLTRWGGQMSSIPIQFAPCKIRCR